MKILSHGVFDAHVILHNLIAQVAELGHASVVLSQADVKKDFVMCVVCLKVNLRCDRSDVAFPECCSCLR